jgi:hypothetical protein
MKPHPSLAVLGLALAIGTGCMQVPARYQQPLPTYPSRAQKALAVEGFTQDQFRPTGIARNFAAGGFHSDSRADTYGRGVTATAQGHASGGFTAGGLAVQGEYVTTSEAEYIRSMLVQTGCLRVVANRDKAEVIVVGSAGAQEADGPLTAVHILEGLTLTPLLGMPIPGRVRGWATASLYTKDGEMVGSLSTSTYLTGFGTLYTAADDMKTALATVRAMAMRDLVEKLADSVCGQRDARR